MQKTFKGGNPFEKPLEHNLKKLKKRIAGNKPALIIIDGISGEGKTTMAVHVADFVQGSPIEFEQQLGQGGDDFVVKLNYCHNHNLPVVIYDEAGDFNTRGALTKFNRMLNEVFDKYRRYKILVIMCLPNFKSIDYELFYKGIPRMLIHCHSRTNNVGFYQVYSQYRMLYLRKMIEEITVPQQAYGFVRPNFKGKFFDLDKKRSDLLDKASTTDKEEALSKHSLRIEGYMTYQELAQHFSVTTNTMRAKVSALQLKPTHKFKRRVYFDKSVVETIKNGWDVS